MTSSLITMFGLLVAVQEPVPPAESFPFGATGVVVVFGSERSGVGLLVGSRGEGDSWWSANFDPALALEWIPDAMAVILHPDSADSSILLSPGLPATAGGQVVLMRRATGAGTYGEAEVVYQAHSDSQAVATAVGSATATHLMAGLQRQAQASNWVPGDPAADVNNPLHEDVVDVPPIRLRGPTPRYPEDLRRAGITGSVLLSFVIGVDGRVLWNSPRVIRATHEGFVAPTIDVIVRSVYSPGQHQGRLVPVIVQQSITYDIQR